MEPLRTLRADVPRFVETAYHLGRAAVSEIQRTGDVVKARCHPLRDKSNGCLLGFLKTKDGTVKDWDGGNAPPPKDF